MLGIRIYRSCKRYNEQGCSNLLMALVKVGIVKHFSSQEEEEIDVGELRGVGRGEWRLMRVSGERCGASREW
jgi:hypothetical protein